MNGMVAEERNWKKTQSIESKVVVKRSESRALAAFCLEICTESYLAAHKRRIN